MTETRQQIEERHAAEYADYLIEHQEAGVEPLNYMNWLAGRKSEEKEEILSQEERAKNNVAQQDANVIDAEFSIVEEKENGPG